MEKKYADLKKKYANLLKEYEKLKKHVKYRDEGPGYQTEYQIPFPVVLSKNKTEPKDVKCFIGKDYPVVEDWFLQLTNLPIEYRVPGDLRAMYEQKDIDGMASAYKSLAEIHNLRAERITVQKNKRRLRKKVI